jgi:SAM-dependent methyltransferase
MDHRERRARSIQQSIAKVLFEEWKPIPGGVKIDEYAAYVSGVYRLLSAGAGPQRIAEHLAEIERDSIGMATTPSANLAVATKLCQLNMRLEASDTHPELPGRDESSGPKLYSSLASWWPLLSAPADYEEEAGLYQKALLAVAEDPPRTMLELGSGGGNNASHLKARFQMTLVDRSPAMLEVSRALNPECEHVQGDMRTVRLDREFDTVFVHDAVCYLTTEADVRQAIDTAFIHCRPGGAALFAPDHVRENFPGSVTDHGGHDGDGRGLRYLEWTWDPDPSDTTYTVDYAYLLRDRDGQMRVELDRHIEGLFPRADWLRWLTEAGFMPSVVAIEHSEVAPGYLAFVCKKPDGAKK